MSDGRVRMHLKFSRPHGLRWRASLIRRAGRAVCESRKQCKRVEFRRLSTLVCRWVTSRVSWGTEESADCHRDPSRISMVAAAVDHEAWKVVDRGSVLTPLMGVSQLAESRLCAGCECFPETVLARSQLEKIGMQSYLWESDARRMYV